MSDHVNAGTHREDHVPVDLNQPIVLEVHNPNGDVTIRAAERSDVLVRHITHGLPRDFDDDGVLTIDAHDNRIEVRAHPHPVMGWGGLTGDVDLEAVVGQITKAFRWGGSWSPGKQGKVRVGSGGQVWCDIAIEVPRAFSGRLDIHTASGDVGVDGVKSEVALTTASGDVRLLHTVGDLSLKVASGDAVIEGMSGRLTAHSASGDLRITAAQIDGFHIQTASGDIRFDAMLTSDGPCRAQTASGDVHLTLRQPTTGGEEPAATLSFHTVSGDAHVGPPFRKIERRRWQAGAGVGGPRIDVTTASGDLTAGFAPADSAFIPSSHPAPPPADVPPPPPVAPVPPAPPAQVVAPAWSASPAEPAPPTASQPLSDGDLTAANTQPEAAQSPAQGDAVRLAVLEAVERGEIDVEEALRRLEAVDATTGPQE